ncbi:protein CHUP1, chloroplastic-like [Cucumis melo]|uniref:Protein CHUP1, chloroplastic-like n=1 Tax=Cucumis melo TaxID=3656 RepID=A0A1S3CSZ9_CUCME|nr:protein CHUP1, chloroplastic-like [Cucumis melo]
MQMMNRISVVVAVSIAAYAIKQLTIRSWTSFFLPTNCSENGEDAKKNGLDEEEEEEEEASSINDATSQVNGRTSDLEDGDHSSDELQVLLPQRNSENWLLVHYKKEEKVPEFLTESNKIESERLLKLVMELEERKVKLEGELLMCDGIKYSETDVMELRKQLDAKNNDISMLNNTISSLQAERKILKEEILKGALMKKELEEARDKIKELQRQIQLDANQTKERLLLLKQRVSTLQAKEEEAVKKEAELFKKQKAAKDFEVELGELKWKNRELQHEKQELTSKLEVMKARIKTLTKMTESEIITKEREEAQKLKSENEDLIKQLEGLQMNRFSEVEELVYLRWINACLRYELRNNQIPAGESARYLNKSSSPKSREKAKQLMLEYAGMEFGQEETDHESNFSHPFSFGIDNLENTSIDSSRSRTSSFSEKPNSNLSLKKLIRNQGGLSAVSPPGISGSSHRWKDPLEAVMALSAETLTLSEVRLQVSSRKSVNSVATSFQLMSKSVEESLQQKYSTYKEHYKLAIGSEKQIKEKAESEKAKSSGDSSSLNLEYHDISMRKKSATLPLKLAQMKNKISCEPDSQNDNDSTNLISNPTSSGGEVHRGSELVQFNQKMMKPEVKAHMETQGDHLVVALAMEVREACFSNMEDIVSFVIRLDEKLSSLVDGMEILEHFDWPMRKTDALREAAFGYQKLMKLREEVSSFVDNPKLTCEVALNKMNSLLDKVEQSVNALLQTRDTMISRYEELGIPIDWLLDCGVVGKIKVLCVELARKYMKRIVKEHNALSGPDKEPNREFLLFQGVRFASRVHKFAGGFDSKSMKAFEELRNRVHTETGQKN